MLMTPFILGVCALILAVFLISTDKNRGLSLKFIKKNNEEHSAQDHVSVIKGSLFILCLVVIFATLLYYFG